MAVTPLETRRLSLVPLTPGQLVLWAEDLPALEAELCCKYDGEPIAEWFRDIVLGQARMARIDPDNFRYYTFWMMLRREDRTVIGSATFKEPPNSRGEVEIGYGLGGGHTGHGYMTEAVESLCRWALNQGPVRSVIAETDEDNPASHKVLERCGFSRYKSTVGTLWWRKDQ